MNQTAIIVYHKQATSARTRFLRGPHGCLFSVAVVPGATPHPNTVMRSLADTIGIPMSALELHEGFRTSTSDCTVYLARATDIDPPQTISPESFGFISLMDARDLPTHEIDLLGAAYREIMGG